MNILNRICSSIFLISGPISLNAKTLLVLLAFSATSVSAEDGLVLWNKLGSMNEALNSEFGPSFEIRQDGGDVLFLDGVFGNGLATTGGTANLGPAGGYLLMNPDDFFAADKTRGTVEFWTQKQLPNLIAYQTPTVTFFGGSHFATGYFSLWAEWHIGVSGPGFINFSVYDGESHSATDYGFELLPAGQWVHMAFVWDGDGIEGSPDDVRIYRDGDLVASHEGRFSEVVDLCCVGYSCGENYCADGYELRVLTNHEGRRLPGCPQYPSGFCPAAYMDNIRVWDHAITDFSNRFIESPFPDSDIVSIDSIAAPEDGFMPFENVDSFPATVGSGPVRVELTTKNSSDISSVTVNGVAATGGPVNWSASGVVLAPGINTVTAQVTTSEGIAGIASVKLTLDSDLDDDGIENGIDRVITIPGRDSIGGPKQASNHFSDQFGSGLGPIKVTVSDDSGTAYVSNYLSNTVSVLDTTFNEVTSTIPVGNRPSGSALAQNQNKLYVTNVSSDSVSVIDTQTNVPVSSILVGSRPLSIATAPDAKGYITGTRALAVIDTVTDTRSAVFPVFNNSDTKRLGPYVPGGWRGRVAGASDRSLLRGGLIDVELAPDKPLAYLSLSISGSRWIKY